MAGEGKRSNRGRPSKYTKAIGDEICLRLVEGESLRRICDDPKLPSFRTVIRWIVKGEPQEFCHQYAQARQAQAEIFADDLQEIADDGRNDWMEVNDREGNCVGYKINGEAVQRSRLRVDTRKWIAERMLPKKYGARQQVEHEAGDGIREFLESLAQSPASTPQGRIKQRDGGAE